MHADKRRQLGENQSFHRRQPAFIGGWEDVSANQMVITNLRLVRKVAVSADLVYNLAAMSHLWTPWRMPYLRGEEHLPEDCLFCIKPQSEDAEAHIVYRDRLCYVILNRFPYNNGHLMIVPYRHAATLENLDPGTLAELMALTQLGLRVLREAYNPQGFNVGLNIGAVAGAGIADHVHLHVIPRWGGDTNCMTTVGQTRVIPEWLDQTYERLRPLFEQLSIANSNQ